MGRNGMMRRSIAMIAVSGSLLAGGVVAATQAQAAVRLGTVTVLPAGETPTAGDNAEALAKCKRLVDARTRTVRYVGKHYIGGDLPTLRFTYRCWG